MGLLRPPSVEAGTRVLRLAGFRAGGASAFPLTAATAPVMAAWVTTEQFQWGLDRILNGLAPERAVGEARR
jgi:hypothetical protein